MERLTYRGANGKGYVSSGYHGSDSTEYKRAIVADRLAAYEDTVLEPEEISDLMVANGEKAEQISRFAKYEEAEEQGRLVVLPCKVGDTLYAPRKNDVLVCKAQYFMIGDDEPSVFVSFECDWECKGCPFWGPYTNYEAGDGGCEGEYGDGTFVFDDIGKHVFLNREAAEAALGKEREHER